MATTAKQATDWKAYNQRRAQIAVRIDRGDKQALDAVLRQRGESISDLLMAYLRPIITEGTPEGQRAHEIISAAVQASIAWNRAQPNYGMGDTEPALDEHGAPIYDAWDVVPAINVRHRITKDGDRVLYHAVTQHQGMTRQMAIQRHVAVLMDAWAHMPEHERDAFLKDISNPNKHRFMIAFSGFSKWTRFPEAYEMRFHYTMHQQPFIAAPANDDEQAFVQWAADHITAAWNARRRVRGVQGAITICEGVADAGGFTVTMNWKHYAIHTDAENIAAWVGLWLNDYRMNRSGGLNHEECMTMMAGERITVQMLTITDE